jgi:hypothetical protein
MASSKAPRGQRPSCCSRPDVTDARTHRVLAAAAENAEDIAPAESGEAEEDDGVGNDLVGSMRLRPPAKAQNKPMTVCAGDGAPALGTVPILLKVMG